MYWSQCHEETVKSEIWSLSEMNRGWRVKLFKKLQVDFLRVFLCWIYRKLLEGEETRFSTSGLSISGLNPLPNPSYLLPPRILSSTTSKGSATGLSLKKEEEEEEASKVASKKTSQIGESFEEILEETVISTKKTEKSNIEENTISSQKI